MGIAAPPLLSTQELADYLGIPLRSLYCWRAQGRGPRGIRVGRHVRYRRADVEAWLDTHADPENA